MSELNDNIQNNPEEKPLTEQELQFCELSRTVHTVVDGYQAYPLLSEDFHDLPDFQIVTSQTAHVLYEQICSYSR